MRRALFLSSPQLWARGHGPSHPLKPERLQRTHQLLEACDAFKAPNVKVTPPRQATESELGLFHTAEYIDIVRALSGGDMTIPAHRFGFGPGDNPVFSGMYESESLKVGSSLQAAQALLDGEADVAFSYGGGLHHGAPNRASGFCVFNDAAVAIQWLLDQGLRIAYVDIDVHHGDGVQDAFYDSDRVLTISLHQDPRTLFPGTGFIDEMGVGAGLGYAVNVPFPPLITDEPYLWAFDEIVPPLLRRFEADIVVTQLGVDTHALDPLANLALTTRGQEQVIHRLASIAPRWLALGGGGYNIDVVPRAWALAFGVMAGLDLPETIPKEVRSIYSGKRLHDQGSVELEPEIIRRVRAKVEQVVATLKDRHHL